MQFEEEIDDWDFQREMMVDTQLISRGIKDVPTLRAMGTVPRHCFVPSDLRKHSYQDAPLPIGDGQTISQPYIVALMTEAAQVKTEDRVLDIGTGSGYAAAIFSRIVDHVYTIERIAALTKKAKGCYTELGYDNIECKVGDGSLGWSGKAPFDAIVVTAGAPVVPESLVEQLSDGGRLIIPVGDAFGQRLLRLTKEASGEVRTETLEYVRFVPLIGAEGWHSS